MLKLRQEHFPFWSRGRLKKLKHVDVLAQADDEFKITEKSDGSGNTDLVGAWEKGFLRGELKNNAKPELNQSGAVLVEFNLNLTRKSMTNLWLAIKWGGDT